MREEPKPYEIYKHFKGNLYQILTLAREAGTEECMVVYQALYSPFGVWVRPLSSFMSPVDQSKYPGVSQEYRFQLQELVSGKEIKAAQEKKMVEEVPGELPEFMTDPDFGEVRVDRQVMEFLESDTYDEKLNILAALHHRVTDEMINTMAAAMDVQIDNGDKEDRFLQLRGCLLTLKKYECVRLR